MSSASDANPSWQRLAGGGRTIASEHESMMHHEPPKAVGYGTRLLVASIFLPVLAMIFTVIFVALAGPKGLAPVTYAPVGGVMVALTLWLILSAFVFRGIGEPEKAVPTSYDDLHARLDKIEAEMATVETSKTTADGASGSAAFTDAATQVAEIRNELQSHDIKWILAQGYASVWARLYRAEEALIDFAPIQTVLQAAYYDELRLNGSEIPGRDKHLATLRTAVEAIDPNATRYLLTYVPPVPPPTLTIRSTSLPNAVAGSAYRVILRASGGIPPHTWRSSAIPKDLQGLRLCPEGVLSGTIGSSGTHQFQATVTDAAGTKVSGDFVVVSAADAAGAPQLPCTDSASLARSALRSVRSIVNEYRNGLWQGLITERNRVIAAGTAMSFAAFLLLALAVMFGATADEVAAGIVFCLVGAAMGLIKRLRDETEAKSAMLDYGLSAARLVTTPLYSGFCALAGVVMIALLPLMSNVLGPEQANATAPTAQTAPSGVGATVSPQGGLERTVTGGKNRISAPLTPPPSQQQSKNAPVRPVLHEIFSLRGNLAGILVAAIFGLTPGLLFARLQQQGDRFKSQLLSSQAAGQAATA
jgi:hypothetical protein